MIEGLVEAVLEKAKRPGVLGAVGARLERACARELRAYFKGLAAGVLECAQFATYSKDAALDATDMKLHNLLRTKREVLRTVLESSLEAAFLAGLKQDVVHEQSLVDRQRAKNGIKEADDQQDLAVKDKVGPTGRDAADYAKKKAAELVTGIDETTRQQIRDAVSEGIDGMLGVPGTSRMIRDVLDVWDTSRADMIASTEINDSFGESAMRRMRALSIEYKQVILSDDACETCQENADADPLPIDELYPSGDLRSPFHPNCRCATTGAFGPDEGDASA